MKHGLNTEGRRVPADRCFIGVSSVAKEFFRLRAVVVLALSCFAAFQPCAHAQLPVPQLKWIFPLGAKAGASAEVELGGNNLENTTKLYFSHAGITAQLLTESKDKKPRFKISVAANVPVGDYDVRSIGKFGISNPRAFVVSDYAEALEVEPNNALTNATPVALNTTVNGRISPGEDVDWFVFPAKKGQRVLIECRAWRVDSRLDGFMWLYDANGKQLVASQDEDIRDQKRDPFIDFDVPADGDYFVKLTDFTYNGNDEHFYRLSISTLPYIDFIQPTGAKPGTTTPVTIYGRNLPGGEKTDLLVKGRPLQKLVRQISVPGDEDTITSLRVNDLIRPASSQLDGMEVRVKTDAGSSNEKLLLFSTLPEVLEAEPNNTTNQAQRLTVPCAVSGQFNPVGDVDTFVFAAKKNEKFSIGVFSERIDSPADPDMEILRADGNVLANPQDLGENIGQIRFTSNSRDIAHSFTAPSDGDFTLRLEHLYRQRQGGPQYFYRLELQRDPQPDFRLVCQPPHEIRIDSHVVYQGGRERFDVLVWRLHGHDEPITVEARNLPPGVTADPIVIGKGVKWGTLVVTAAPGAPIGEGEIQLVGTSEVNGQKLTRKARGGVIVWDTVNTPAISRMTRSIVMAVREKAAFQITASPAEITVVAGEPINLTLTAKRRDDMPNAIQLNGASIQLPPGMEIPVKSIAQGETEQKLTIATDKMREGTYSFLVNGDGQVPVEGKNTRCIYPSNAIKVTVLPKKAK